MNISSPNPNSGFGSHWLVRTGLADRGDIVTFYSYKGGTGRTMALVNCAGLIAQNLPTDAKPLLLIDFDLEAPGLHRYLAPFLPSHETGTPQQGLLELFAALLLEIDRNLSDLPKSELSEIRRLDDETTAEIIGNLDLAPFTIQTTVTGLNLIMAGQFDDTYAQRLSHFNWEDLFAKAPGVFRCLADRLAREYSFTFVDSRTGLSDTSGICTMLLPNVLVVVFTPNNQSLTGIEHLVRKAVDYRSSASDSRELRVYPLPSRVDNQVEHFRHVWRMGDSQNKLFGTVKGYQPLFQEVLEFTLGMDGKEAPHRLAEYFDVIQVPHSADYSYGERLCFQTSAPGDSLSLRGSYEQFLPWLVTGAQPWERPGELLLAQQASEWLHDLGVDTIPESNEGWFEWFKRLSGVIENAEYPVLIQQSLLSPDLRFDTNLVQALAYAYKGDFSSSSNWLKRAMSSYSEDVASTIPNSAPMQLLTLWIENLSPADLRTSERKAWIKEFEQLVSRWQAIWSQRRIWLVTIIQLANKAGWQDMEQLALQQLVSLNQETLGNEHPDTLSAMGNLAIRLSRQGQYAEAGAVQRQVLELSQRVLGAEDPRTLTAMNNLALTLTDRGEYAEAVALQRQSLELSQGLLGPEHFDTLTAMGNLAMMLSRQGKYAEAVALQRQVLESSQGLLGAEDPFALTAMGNLALTLSDQGDYAEAIALQRQALELSQSLLGPEHFDTLTAINNLAMMLSRQGEYIEAIALQRQVLESSQGLLGVEHPNTLTAMGNLALTLYRQGEYIEAITLQRQVFELCQRVLGPEHPFTLTAMVNFAKTLSDQGEYAEAITLQRQAIELSQRVLGPEHPRTLTAINNLALTLSDQGEYAEAIALQRQVLELRKSVLGDGHPDSLIAMNNLAMTQLAQSKYAEASALQREALELSQRVFGAEHPSTLTAMSNLANMLQAQGELSPARELYQKSLNGFRRVMGENNRITWINGMELAAIDLEMDDASHAAIVLDGFTSPQLTIDNAQWLGLRLKIAEKLGAKEDIVRFQRRSREILRKA
ncbi:tetratricopeptide repeat protein [Nitrospira sp. MA-1]|nr:tetratricopeptide repeat protein [Nitrospira sp. MA-1]